MNRITLLLTQGLNKRVLHFLVELLCIVIAVTLSFYLDDLREDRKDREVLKGVIESLIIDIHEYSTDYKSQLRFSNAAIDTIDLCLRLAQERKPIPKIAIEALVYYIGNDHSFETGSSPAYVGLLSSQVWQEIPDSIRQSVFHLYEFNIGWVKVTVARVADYCAFVKDHYFPMLHVDLYNVKGDEFQFESRNGDLPMKNIQKALIHPEFRSALIVLRNHYHKVTIFQNDAIAESDRTVVRLERYVSEL